MGDALKTNTVNMPEHVAVIMDGNGRWAKAKGFTRTQGHNEGAKALERLVKAASESGVKYLTVYAFSSENWQRSKSEVSALMNLLDRYLRDCIAKSGDSENNIRYCFMGNMAKLSPELQKNIDELQRITANKNGLCLNVALSYGGREEIVSAARNIAEDVKNGRLDSADIDETMFAQYLYNSKIPYPDLLIRTSGEKRISNFLLWQSAYTEMVFLDVLWPDFSETDFQYALGEYGKRKRRFGNV